MTQVIRRRDLVRALGDHGLADWSLVEHDMHVGTFDTAAGERAEKRLSWVVTVHHDAPTGRGSAHVTIDAAAGDAESAIREAVTLARASVGPAWTTQPAAAPAHVVVADPAFVARDPVALAAEIARSTPAASANVRILRDKVTVASRQGLRTDWTATQVRADLLVTSGGRSLRIVREERDRAALRLDAAIHAAKLDLDLLVKAPPLTPGPCTILVRADAMLHDGLGIWATLVPQADAVVERQGLTRYRERMPIAAGADTVPEPLSVSSDGALDGGLYSAPLGEQGDAVRRFPIVDRGIAAGLALTPREAALRGRDPNGGVRNLVVATGTWPGTLDSALTGSASPTRIIELRRLRSFTFDPYTGDASLEIALALEHDGHGSSMPRTGASLRIDMIAALARARRSSTRLVRGPYAGPDSVLIDAAEIIA